MSYPILSFSLRAEERKVCIDGSKYAASRSLEKQLFSDVLESLFNKVAGLQALNFIKERLQRRFCSVKLAKFLRTPAVAASVSRPFVFDF